MKFSYFVAICVLAMGVYYGKLLYDRDLAIAKVPLRSSDDGGTPPATTSAEPPPPPAPPPPPSEKKPPREPEVVLTPAEERTLDDAKAHLAAGRLQQAVDAAHQVATGATTVGLKTAASRFADKARLFLALTAATRPHPFATASDLVAVTLAATGKSYIARLVKETKDAVTLRLEDGTEREVRPDQIKKRENLPPGKWADFQRTAIEKKKTELTDPSALELFHVAFDAFEVGLGDEGVRLLERALTHPAGGAIVDVYGSGDLEVLRRAQERMGTALWRSGGGDSTTIAQATGVHTRPDTTKPSTDTPPPPPPPPAPPPPSTGGPEPPPDETPARPLTEDEKLQQDKSWLAAKDAYSKGCEFYRTGVKGQTAAEKQALRSAEKELARAREALDKVPNYGNSANVTWDELSKKVNEILRDVKKRKAATGS